MNYKIRGYKPEKLFHCFEEISAIPRGSGNEKAISDYLVRFAEERGLEVYQDDSFNVLIRKDACGGAVSKTPVMLQGHLDMVCDSLAGTEHDFEKEGINLVLNDGVLSADGTTLGADNGAAVALMMAVLDDDSLTHPPLECVFTTEEEIGLNGASAFDKSKIHSRILINLDSEDEGVATVSCAGGMRIDLTRRVTRVNASGMVLRLEVSGLMGGHSGMDINKERQNADLIMARMAEELIEKTGAGLVSLCGGTKDNAIPRECEAVLLCENAEEAEAARKEAVKFAEVLTEELRPYEPGIVIKIDTEERQEVSVLSKEDAKALTGALRLIPNGVLRADYKPGGFVIASVNLGIVRTEEDRIVIASAPRSSVASLQEDTKNRFKTLAGTFGFEIGFRGEYPGWSYQENSLIRRVFQESYRGLFQEELKIEEIHAGLECGLFVDAIPGMDAISVGPTIRNVHTPDEEMPLDSMERFWQLLEDVLRQLGNMDNGNSCEIID